MPEELPDFQNLPVSRHHSAKLACNTVTVFLDPFHNTIMKQRFYIYRRGETFYLQDARTGKQQSLGTKDRKAAWRLLEIKRQTVANPGFNQFLLKSCLTTQDPLLGTRTWQSVMDQMQTHGKDSTKMRCACAMKSKALDALRPMKLVETNAENFLTILNGSKVSVAHYLKRLHNLALGLGWLAFPILAPRLWPKPHFKSKRGIRLAEHQRIISAEKNSERNLYYQLLWEIGSSQSDAAMLTAENIDWPTRSLTYFRMKTGEQAQLAISNKMAAILEQLPAIGPLFPKIAATTDSARSAEFYRRCKVLGIEGVSLHSYRYAWAERAKTCGYPERFAQSALGHSSQAVHRAYSKKAQVRVPSLEEYEGKIVPLPVAVNQ
jgi:integrase